MSDDELLYAMGASLRDGVDLHDDLWDRLAAGEVGAEELAALRADPDPEVQAALAAFAPLSDADLDRLEAVAQAALGPAPAAQVIPFPARRHWFIGAAVALAAALLVFVLRPSPPTAPTLPAYALEFTGGDRVTRSDGAPTPRRLLRPDSLVQITLRPPEALSNPVFAAGFLVAGETQRPIAASLTSGANGVVTYDGTARALLGDAPAGDWTLVILLTSAAPAEGPDADGRRVEQRLRWVP